MYSHDQGLFVFLEEGEEVLAVASVASMALRWINLIQE
jgi:hypothetical protein